MPKKKSVTPFLFLYPLVLYLALLLASHYDPNAKNVLAWLPQIVERPFYIVWNGYSIKLIAAMTVLYGMAVSYYLSVSDNTRKGQEHGSAKWGDPKRLRSMFGDSKKPLENLIFTENTRLGLDAHKHMRNLNVTLYRGQRSGQNEVLCPPKHPSMQRILCYH